MLCVAIADVIGSVACNPCPLLDSQCGMPATLGKAAGLVFLVDLAGQAEGASPEPIVASVETAYRSVAALALPGLGVALICACRRRMPLRSQKSAMCRRDCAVVAQ